jgi:hypothetical protein
MRQMPRLAVLLVLAAGVLSDAAPASGARVLELENGRVRVYQEPALDGVATNVSAPAAAARHCTRCLARLTSDRRARVSRSDPVRRAVTRAVAGAQVAAADGNRYLGIYRNALGLLPRLSLQRERELGYVIATLRRIARRGGLTATRMPALFLVLDRNREWWARKGAPAANARIRFGTSEVIFQYYPGLGLQLQPLANFGYANGLWQSRQDRRLRSLIDELVAIRTSRGGFTTWEYYFHFGGGSPPWISGMAQATAMQALARAGARFADQGLLEIARSGVGAFEQRTPVGVRVRAGSGAWYALYSFAPRLYVLNGMLQALIGLDSYRVFAGDQRGTALFDQGDRVARARIPSYDTGAWSLYSRGTIAAGGEANLNYHTLNRDFARRLCRITTAQPYCSAADNFSRYLKEEPRLRPSGPAPAPAVAGRGVRFHFTLSKIGRVGITVRAKGRTYLSTSALFTRGRHFFRWVPPRSTRERTYDYALFARDLAGNTASELGTLRVKR